MTIRLSITLLVFAWSFCGTVYGQRISGEIRLRVKDSTGASLEASGLLQSLATGVHRRFQTDTEGFHLFRGLSPRPLSPRGWQAGLLNGRRTYRGSLADAHREGTDPHGRTRRDRSHSARSRRYPD